MYESTNRIGPSVDNFYHIKPTLYFILLGDDTMRNLEQDWREWSDSSAYVELSILYNDAALCAYSGDNNPDIVKLMSKDYIAAQLSKLSDEQVFKAIDQYMPPYDKREDNLKFLLWTACWDIMDSEYLGVR